MKVNIKNIRIKSICAILFISLFLSCNSGVIEELEKKKSFADSLLNIGYRFQEIFTSFGNTIGDALGFSAVKFDDTRDKVGVHFDKVKKGLEDTKGKLDGLAKEISSTPNADTKGVETVKTVIQGSNDVFDKLIGALTKLADVAKSASSLKIGENDNGNSVIADEEDVNKLAEGVKTIIEVANKFGVEIKPGTPGNPVTNTNYRTNNKILKINFQCK
ncbi:variable large family protein (plasmid) [Borrelia coriaceae]|uniref:Variable large protein n=1 Tax=Borrelia coriaceae ATCC 43381 TaxID=1408429 RepID=W5T1Z8_9SPIR|nr:variable large family protein [Borrelia coriaceae]AHH11316.1 Variable major protein [Borrelia coriaceae ATCC 43381]UPA17363.1 variable large family protein [Borrelia coriaceae]